MIVRARLKGETTGLEKTARFAVLRNGRTMRLVLREDFGPPAKENGPQLAWSPSAPAGRCSEDDKGENKKSRKRATLRDRDDYIFDGKLGLGCGVVAVRRKWTVHTV